MKIRMFVMYNGKLNIDILMNNANVNNKMSISDIQNVD